MLMINLRILLIEFDEIENYMFRPALSLFSMKLITKGVSSFEECEQKKE